MLFTRAGLTLCFFVLSASASLHRIQCPAKDKKGVKKSFFGNRVFSFSGKTLVCNYKGGAGKCEYRSKSPHYLMNGSDDCPTIKDDKHRGIVHKIFHPKKKSSSSTSHSSTKTSSSSKATSTTKHRKNKHNKTKSASSSSATSHSSSKTKKFKTSRSSTTTSHASATSSPAKETAFTTTIKPTFSTEVPGIRIVGGVSTVDLHFSSSSKTASKTSSASHSATPTPTPNGFTNIKFSSDVKNKTNITANLAKSSAPVGVSSQGTLLALIPALALAFMAL